MDQRFTQPRRRADVALAEPLCKLVGVRRQRDWQFGQ